MINLTIWSLQIAHLYECKREDRLQFRPRMILKSQKQAEPLIWPNTWPLVINLPIQSCHYVDLISKSMWAQMDHNFDFGWSRNLENEMNGAMICYISWRGTHACTCAVQCLTPRAQAILASSPSRVCLVPPAIPRLCHGPCLYLLCTPACTLYLRCLHLGRRIPTPTPVPCTAGSTQLLVPIELVISNYEQGKWTPLWFHWCKPSCWPTKNQVFLVWILCLILTKICIWWLRIKANNIKKEKKKKEEKQCLPSASTSSHFYLWTKRQHVNNYSSII